MILQFLAAFGGTVAFAVLFGVPRKHYIFCGLIGMAGWIAYLLLEQFTFLSAAEATFFATGLVMLLSRFAAVLQQCPATVFSICGIFPLIPGGGIYWAAYYAVMDDTAQALSAGFNAVKVVCALVLGMVIVQDIPDRFFHRKGHPTAAK